MIRKMFNDDEVLEAATYMATNALNCKEDEISDLDICPFIIAYGANCPQMANYAIVENTVMDKVLSHIISYLSITNKNYKIIQLPPPSIHKSAFVELLSKNPSKLFELWPPAIKWDLNPCFDNIEKQVTNPLNNFTKLDLVLCNVCNKLFMNKLVLYGIIDYKALDKSVPVDLIIKLLPNSDLNRILNLIDIIHTFY